MSSNESRSRFVTVAEVAAALRVSNMTVYRLVQSGQLPAVRVGRSYRIREEDLDRYLGEQFTAAG
ncbi:MAG TPA: helix-turn-helix domain-containing protein [Acidimicrobiales bacterium]|nr:helix-turn-helix domain-containing protein [Acidimicrobiales bacterium]